MTAAAEIETPLAITRPGIYDEITDVDYHRDPVPGGSLSSTGARGILPPGCPALFAHQREHGRPDTAAFDYGHAAHNLVLGKGAELVVVDAPDWRTKKAKEAAAEARLRGATPILAKDYEQVVAMAAALRDHPVAAALLDPASGRAETSGFWVDQRADIWCRVRYDFLPWPTEGRLIIPDYKTSETADPDSFARAAARFGYPQQDDFYTRAARALDLADDIAFVFVVQQKTPPFLVSVCELDPVDKRIGHDRNRRAMDLFGECQSTGHWPGYGDDVHPVSTPRWYQIQSEEQA